MSGFCSEMLCAGEIIAMQHYKKCLNCHMCYELLEHFAAHIFIFQRNLLHTTKDSFREVWILIWSDLVNLNCVTTVNGIEILREQFVWSGVVICRLHLLVLVSELVIPVFSLTVATGLCCVT